MSDEVNESGAKLYFGSTNEFVCCWLRWAWQHQVDGKSTFWAPNWWAYPEAVARFTVLWHGWEACRQESGPSLSSWWVQHLDPHMRELTSQHGPFRENRQIQVFDVYQPLPLIPVPAGNELLNVAEHTAHLTGGCPGELGTIETSKFNIFVTPPPPVTPTDVGYEEDTHSAWDMNVSYQPTDWDR